MDQVTATADVVTPGTVQKTREMAAANTVELVNLREDVKYLRSLLEGELLGLGEKLETGVKCESLVPMSCLASEVAAQVRIIVEIRRLIREVARRVDDRKAVWDVKLVDNRPAVSVDMTGAVQSQASEKFRNAAKLNSAALYGTSTTEAVAAALNGRSGFVSEVNEGTIQFGGGR